MKFTMSDKIPSWNIVHKLEKRQLLIAINCVAALSILFFGYDQGMMSGVNNWLYQGGEWRIDPSGH